MNVVPVISLMMLYFLMGLFALWVTYKGVLNAVRRKIAPSKFVELISLTSGDKIVFYCRSRWGHEYYSSVNGIQIYTKTKQAMTFPDEWRIVSSESIFERPLFDDYKPDE